MELTRQYIDKLAWVHIKNKKILSTRSKGKNTYYIPGGKRENGETDHQALIREIKEELSVDLIPETIQFVGSFQAQAHGKPEGMMVRMTCYTGKFKGEFACASEIDEAVWLSHKDRERSSTVDKDIFDWLKERDLIE